MVIHIAEMERVTVDTPRMSPLFILCTTQGVADPFAAASIGPPGSDVREEAPTTQRLDCKPGKLAHRPT